MHVGQRLLAPQVCCVHRRQARECCPCCGQPDVWSCPGVNLCPGHCHVDVCPCKTSGNNNNNNGRHCRGTSYGFLFLFYYLLAKIKQNNVICSQLWSSRSQLWSSRSRLWSSCNQLWSSCGSQESCRCKHSRPSRRCSCHNNGRVNSCFCRLRFRRRRHRRRHRDPGRRYKAGGCGGRERNPGCKDC